MKLPSLRPTRQAVGSKKQVRGVHLEVPLATSQSLRISQFRSPTPSKRKSEFAPSPFGGRLGWGLREETDRLMPAPTPTLPQRGRESNRTPSHALGRTPAVGMRPHRYGKVGVLNSHLIRQPHLARKAKLSQPSQHAVGSTNRTAAEQLRRIFISCFKGDFHEQRTSADDRPFP